MTNLRKAAIALISLGLLLPPDLQTAEATEIRCTRRELGAWVVAAAATGALGGGLVSQFLAPRPTSREVYRRAFKESGFLVQRIGTGVLGQKPGQGTGCAISLLGLGGQPLSSTGQQQALVTSYHVVSGQSSVNVAVPQDITRAGNYKYKWRQARVAGFHEAADVAILEFADHVTRKPLVPAFDLADGEPFGSFGFPYGNARPVEFGSILEVDARRLTITASVDRGMSGGALCVSRGSKAHFAGLNWDLSPSPSGSGRMYGGARPSWVVIRALQRILTETGPIEATTMGLEMQSTPAEELHKIQEMFGVHLGLSHPTVTAVFPFGPAGAHVQPGDVLLSVESSQLDLVGGAGRVPRLASDTTLRALELMTSPASPDSGAQVTLARPRDGATRYDLVKVSFEPLHTEQLFFSNWLGHVGLPNKAMGPMDIDGGRRINGGVRIERPSAIARQKLGIADQDVIYAVGRNGILIPTPTGLAAVLSATPDLATFVEAVTQYGPVDHYGVIRNGRHKTIDTPDNDWLRRELVSAPVRLP